MVPALVAYRGLVLVTSLACFTAYGWDKRQALRGGRRVPESTLQTLAFLGGWPGGLMGQRRFRHKTKKLRFLILFWALVAFHLSIVGSVAYWCIASDL